MKTDHIRHPPGNSLPNFFLKLMGCLKAVLEEGSSRYDFTTPFKNIERLREPRSNVEPFTLSEIHTFMTFVHESFRDYYWVRFFTAMRTAEIDGLRWEYVDLHSRLILQRQHKLTGAGDYVFTNLNGNPLEHLQHNPPCPVIGDFRIRDAEFNETRNGQQYMRFFLEDMSGSIPAYIWKEEIYRDLYLPNFAVVRVAGNSRHLGEFPCYNSHRCNSMNCKK